MRTATILGIVAVQAATFRALRAFEHDILDAVLANDAIRTTRSVAVGPYRGARVAPIHQASVANVTVGARTTKCQVVLAAHAHFRQDVHESS